MPYVNTAIAVVLGVVGLHEPLTVGIIVGFPLVLIGSIFATSSARRDNSSDFVIRSDSNLVINE